MIEALPLPRSHFVRPPSPRRGEGWAVRPRIIWALTIGFLLCLRAPQRFERFLVLNIVPPWVSLRSVVGHAWRFWYQQAVLAPGLGYRLHRNGEFIRRILVRGSEVRDAWDVLTATSRFMTN